MLVYLSWRLAEEPGLMVGSPRILFIYTIKKIIFIWILLFIVIVWTKNTHCCACSTGAGVPLMAAGGGAGVITVWNLEERKLATVIRDAHDGPLSKTHFFAGEPVLMSSAADNSVKHWIFDNADGTARLLRFRSGHASPPMHVRCSDFVFKFY